MDVFRVLHKWYQIVQRITLFSLKQEIDQMNIYLTEMKSKQHNTIVLYLDYDCLCIDRLVLLKSL